MASLRKAFPAPEDEFRQALTAEVAGIRAQNLFPNVPRTFVSLSQLLGRHNHSILDGRRRGTSLSVLSSYDLLDTLK